MWPVFCDKEFYANALSRANLISTFDIDGKRIVIHGCVNALSRASLISTATLEKPHKYWGFQG